MWPFLGISSFFLILLQDWDETALCWQPSCEARCCHQILVRVCPTILNISHYFSARDHEMMARHQSQCRTKAEQAASTNVAYRAFGVRSQVRFLIGVRKSATLWGAFTCHSFPCFQRWSGVGRAKARSPFYLAGVFRPTSLTLHRRSDHSGGKTPTILIGSLSTSPAALKDEVGLPTCLVMERNRWATLVAQTGLL